MLTQNIVVRDKVGTYINLITVDRVGKLIIGWVDDYWAGKSALVEG